MHHPPRKGFHGHIHDVGTGLGHLQHGGHRKPGARMPVVLDQEVRIFCFDGMGELPEHHRTPDPGHILQADLVRTVFHHLVDHLHVVVDRMEFGVGDTEGGLGDHARLLGIFHRKLEVAVVVEPVERAGNIGPLGVLYLIHQPPHIGRHREHADPVECPFEHMGLDARLVEGLGPFTHRLVGIFAIEQVYLLEGPAIGLHAGKASHVDDHGGDAGELVDAGHVFARRLPHVAVDEAEFYRSLFCHILFPVFLFLIIPFGFALLEEGGHAFLSFFRSPQRSDELRCIVDGIFEVVFVE